MEKRFEGQHVHDHTHAHIQKEKELNIMTLADQSHSPHSRTQSERMRNERKWKLKPTKLS